MGLSQTPQALVPAEFTSGGMTLISQTVASALSSLSFTSLGSYKQLFLIWAGIQHSTTGSAYAIRFNNDSASNYVNVGSGFVGTSTAFEVTDGASINVQAPNSIYSFGESANYNAIGQNVQGSLLLDNYTSSTKFKSYKTQCYYFNNGSSSYRGFNVNGVYESQTAITSLDIVSLSGSATFSNTANTTIRLYGIS